MKITVSARLLLVVAIVLLAANFVTLFLVNGARPAAAQSATRQCVGVAINGYYNPKNHWAGQVIARSWSDGSVDLTWSEKPNADWVPWITLPQ